MIKYRSIKRVPIKHTDPVREKCAPIFWLPVTLQTKLNSFSWQKTNRQNISTSPPDKGLNLSCEVECRLKGRWCEDVYLRVVFSWKGYRTCPFWQSSQMKPFSRHKLQLKTWELANLITLDRKGASFPSITLRMRREEEEREMIMLIWRHVFIRHLIDFLISSCVVSYLLLITTADVLLWVLFTELLTVTQAELLTHYLF